MFQQKASGTEFVAPGIMARRSGDENDALFRRAERAREEKEEPHVPGLRTQLHFFFFSPLSSRFCFNSSSVTVDSTPLGGASILAIQRMAFRTVLRKSSLAQFLWKCPPVKPKPRPPSGRSIAHITCSGSPLCF